VAEIVRSGEAYMFGIGRGGLCGNEDSGGLSSLYVMNALGIFPVAGQDIFLLGSPCVQSARIKFFNGNVFTVLANGNSPKNIYPTNIRLNGKPLDRLYLTVSEVMAGGKLSMDMAPTPA
jgi:putative alpha-1,2-mannosidase